MMKSEVTDSRRGVLLPSRERPSSMEKLVGNRQCSNRGIGCRLTVSRVRNPHLFFRFLCKRWYFERGRRKVCRVWLGGDADGPKWRSGAVVSDF